MNRLQFETSPYLKQHAENPVDWYPWGPEALEKAKREDKPILLSVGYSACHWCHVMAHESFENAEIAALMNAHFVNVKVDREERPDLDQIYQNVAQAITRGGGWPLTVFLLPDQRPFFGGTYFPPEDRWGRPGFPRVLQSLSDAYRNDRPSVVENAEKLTQIIGDLERNDRADGPSVADAPTDLGGSVSGDARFAFLAGIAEDVLGGVDWQHGGFGGAPKFPNSMMLSYLWRMGSDPRGAQDFREPAIAAVILSLTKMAKAGIFDQLGGGFHRYSVDERWAVPHFEKMLYDNGLLLQLYAEAVAQDRITKILRPETRELFRVTIEKTVAYLLREMEHPAGGFYAAQDADSEGEEGKFFAWDERDLAAILSPADSLLFRERYGVDAKGNFEHGKTVLFQDRTLEEVAANVGLTPEVARERLAAAEEKVFQARDQRIHPGLDDKLLTGWNGLVITGLVWAAHALGENSAIASRAREAAVRAFRRFASESEKSAGALPATIQADQAKGNAYLDDYAFLARAGIDLFRFTGDVDFLRSAGGWIDRIFTRFQDLSGDPGFFFTADDHESLLQRPKSLYDQAIPSGTSVTLASALTLGELGEHFADGSGKGISFLAAGHLQEARAQITRLKNALRKNPFGYGELASAFLLEEGGLRVFGGKYAVGAVISDRDFVLAKSPLFSAGAVATAGRSEGRLQVCERGVCREFSDLEKWAESVSTRG